MDIYAQNILDHYKNPHNRGELKNPDAVFKSLNSTCGDQIQTSIKVENGVLKKINFEGHGCAVAIATSSILSDFLIGKKISEVLAMDLTDVKKILGINISSRRYKCALIGLHSLQGAINLLAAKNKDKK